MSIGGGLVDRELLDVDRVLNVTDHRFEKISDRHHPDDVAVFEDEREFLVLHGVQNGVRKTLPTQQSLTNRASVRPFGKQYSRIEIIEYGQGQRPTDDS